MGEYSEYIAEHKGTKIGRNNFKLKVLLLLEHYFKHTFLTGEAAAWWSAGDIAKYAFVNYNSAYVLLPRWAANSKVWGYVNSMVVLPEWSSDSREHILYSINKHGLTWIRRARERGVPGLVTGQEDIDNTVKEAVPPEYFSKVAWPINYYDERAKRLYTGAVMLEWPFKSKFNVRFSRIPVRPRMDKVRHYIVNDINAAVNDIIRPIFLREPGSECIKEAVRMQSFFLKSAADHSTTANMLTY